ncbi:MAG: glutamine--fructose-6-phosphate aminotransferase, partial [Nitrospinota bacterium]
MSGIVGFIGSENAAMVMIEALAKLEHRGYDSCGLGVLSGREVVVRKELGGIKKLEASIASDPVSGSLGIGHTRWATHGKVSIENAHPQLAGRVALVHNGIIDNYVTLRERLLGKGRKFFSTTDTEVLAHLIDLKFSGNLKEAVSSALREVEGKYALAAFSPSDPDKIVAAARGISIAVGLGSAKFIIASDV